VTFREQHRIWGMKNPMTGHGLRLDFFVPSLRLAVEFDGVQHERPLVRASSMTPRQAMEVLRQQRIRDRAKDRFCGRNGIRMLRIRWTEIGRVPTLLAQAIS
jgi:very-short-patch-repair endonuclease